MTPAGCSRGKVYGAGDCGSYVSRVNLGGHVTHPLDVVDGDITARASGLTTANRAADEPHVMRREVMPIGGRGALARNRGAHLAERVREGLDPTVGTRGYWLGQCEPLVPCGIVSVMDGLRYASKKQLLRAALARQERTVGQLLDEIERHPHLSLREETVTERMLLDLAFDPAFRSAATASTFSTKVEGSTGADWLWVFQGRGGGTSQLLVQAKRLRHGRYALNQRPAPSQRSQHETQRAVLLAHSSATGLPAAYAFYNPGLMARALTVGCGWEVMLGPLGGVSLADAGAVDAAVRSTGVTAEHVDAGIVSDVAWPLSCALLCAERHADDQGISEPLDVLVEQALSATGIRIPDAEESEFGYIAATIREFTLQQDNREGFDELMSVLRLRGVMVVRERVDV